MTLEVVAQEETGKKTSCFGHGTYASSTHCFEKTINSKCTHSGLSPFSVFLLLFFSAFLFLFWNFLDSDLYMCLTGLRKQACQIVVGNAQTMS